MEEKILVVQRDKLFSDIETPQGFGTEHLEDIIKRIRASHEFVNRGDAENDPSLKQVIPYMVVCFGDNLFLMHRFDNQDEERLRNLYSLGVGGHISQAHDEGSRDVLMAGLKREMNEEIEIATPYELEAVGYINDETNEVGRVHFGLAYKVAVRSDHVQVREKDLMSGSFVPVEAAQKVYPQMETWSQIVLKNIDYFLRSG